MRAKHGPAGSAAAGYGAALGIVAASTGLCWWTRSVFTLADQAMVYLLGVLVASVLLGRRASLLAAAASVGALDFFFVPPFFTFDVEHLRFLITFGVMLLAGATVSHLTHRIRQQAVLARQREARTATLYAVSREFAVERQAAEIAATAVLHVRTLAGVPAAVFLANAAGELVSCGGGAEGIPGARELEHARRVFEAGRTHAGGGDATASVERRDADGRDASEGAPLRAHGLFLPLLGTRDPLGVFWIGTEVASLSSLPASQRQLLETLVAQTALALERAMLAEQAAAADVTAGVERTRSALLSAVSHDLRTPLATITGTADALLDERVDLPQEARRELMETIRDEAGRLSRLISNLLDLTRLESGVLRVRKEPCPLEEMVASSLERLARLLAGRDVRIELPDEMLLVGVDPLLIEQVLANLIENAVRYSPPDAPIEIAAAARGGEVQVSVRDHGRGIPPGEETRLFEKFYQTEDGRRAGGAGLGLAICQAIVRAHGGHIEAGNHPEGGAVFRFTLPLEAPAPDLEDLHEEHEEHEQHEGGVTA